MRTLYDALGVAPTADACAVRSAFIALAKVHHPDNNPGDETAARRFREISTAREVLKDPESREAYDAFLRIERQRSRWRSLRAAMGYSLVFAVTFCVVLVGAKQRISPPPGELEVVAPAGTMRQSPKLAFAHASDQMLLEVARGAPEHHSPSPASEVRPAAAPHVDESPSAAAVHGGSPSPRSEEHASERPARPIDTRPKDPVAMRDVRVRAFYRDRKGVLHQVVRVLRVEHEEP
jgi:curved DNA-binding protein CbpA